MASKCLPFHTFAQDCSGRQNKVLTFFHGFWSNLGPGRRPLDSVRRDAEFAGVFASVAFLTVSFVPKSIFWNPVQKFFCPSNGGYRNSAHNQCCNFVMGTAYGVARFGRRYKHAQKTHNRHAHVQQTRNIRTKDAQKCGVADRRFISESTRFEAWHPRKKVLNTISVFGLKNSESAGDNFA